MRLLFLCSQGRLRSRTAAAIYSERPGVEARFAGLDADTDAPLQEVDVEWADHVLVMERSHHSQLSRRFKEQVRGKRVHVLDIPDEYDYMQPELVRLLKTRVGRCVGAAIDETLNLWSDGASLYLFDPAACADVDPDELQFPYHLNPAVRDGTAVMVHLPDDGTFRVRVTGGEPATTEAELIQDSVENLGLRVRSGRVYASGMDMPGTDADTLAEHGAGSFVGVDAGVYNVAVHLLRTTDLPQDRRPTVPDYLVVLSFRDTAFAAVESAPRLSDVTDDDVAQIIARLQADR